MKLVRIAILSSLLALALALPALTATAASPKAGTASVRANAAACPGSIRMGGKRFAVYRRRVTCRGAFRAMRTLYATYGRRGTPRGFRCRSQSRFRKTGGCVSKTDGRRYFGYTG